MKYFKIDYRDKSEHVTSLLPDTKVYEVPPDFLLF
jgi:hypothetical protein